MDLDARDGAPVELKCRTGGVHLDGSAVGSAENVELIMLVVDGHGIVGLVGRPLGAERMCTQDGEQYHEAARESLDVLHEC